MPFPLIEAPRRWLQAAYDWTLHWAETRQSLVALFLIAVAESSVFPIPPDVLLIAIVAARRDWWARAAAVCSAGSVLGGAIGYAIGAGLMATVGQRVVDFYSAQGHWDRVVGIYQGEWGVWFLAAAAFTPIPYKVATLAAGATAMPFVAFVGVSLVGRSARFFLVAAILRVFGQPVRCAVELHFDKVALAFLILLVLAFVTLGDF
jgi:membrane protein YqaA with SNARE-associated domain